LRPITRSKRSARLVCAQLQRGRVGERDVVAADMPVRRRDQAPREVADLDAVGGRGLGGERQTAIGAAPALGLGPGAFVRRGQRQRIVVVAMRQGQAGQQLRQVRQREVAQHLRGRFGQRRREGDQQMHGRDYPARCRGGAANASCSIPPP
jgi:hypothetical protein